MIGFTEYTNPRYRTAPHHRLIAAKLEAVERGEIDRLMLMLPPRHGKALAVSTPIATPSGWTQIGKLRAGDMVFDDMGAPCRVVAVSEIWKDRPVFEVMTDDGDSIIADANHDWRVRLDRKSGGFSIRSTEWLAARTSPRAPMIAAQGALALPPADLPVDPYVLGAWLGDGRTQSSEICSADTEIIAEISRIEGGLNHYAARGVARNFRIGPHYRKGATAAETLQGRLRALGVIGHKRIPIQYLRASISQRKALLQGLIDTDGYVANDGQIEFCSTIVELAEGVKELVHSLGHKASIVSGRAMLDGRDCGPKFRVMFYMAGAARLSRKAQKTRHGMRAFRRYVTFREAGRANTVCIEVDSPSHMFLAGKSMLPTHNSELGSRRFPAFCLGRNPTLQFIGASASMALAGDLGREVRNTIASEQYRAVFATRLAEDSRAANKWNTPEGGGYYAVGAGGQIMGRGADILLIDDPFGTMADAQSPTIRKTIFEWYQGSLYNRLQPGGRIVVIGHRMHEDDLNGQLLEMQAAGGDRWEVVDLPAIARADVEDVLGRAPGEALWPQSYPIEALERIRANTLPRFWNALFQQRPTPDEGELFAVQKIGKRDDRAGIKFWVRAWDLAGSVDGDYSVGVLMGRTLDNRFVVADVVRVRGTPEVVEDAIVTTARHDTVAVRISLPQDPGQAGKSQIVYLTRALSGFAVTSSPETGDKVTRAEPLASQVNQGKVTIVNGEWNAPFIAELRGFPHGKFDDQVDAASRAFSVLTATKGPMVINKAALGGRYGNRPA